MTIGLQAARQLRNAMTLPVLMKEMRSRMRGTRTQVLLFISTGLAILVGMLIVQAQWNSFSTYSSDYGQGQYNMAEIGRSLFVGLIILEGVLCALIAPALTAGAISTEREHQTMDLLLLTRLSSDNIVVGKFLSSLSLLGIILLCSLPVGAISFIFGGVDPVQFLMSLALVLAVACLFGMFGLFASSRFRQTTTSVVVSYVICVGWVGLIPLIVWLLSLWDHYGSMSTSGWVLLMCLTVGMLLLLAVAPPAVVSLLWMLFTRQKPARLFNLILWGVSAIIACLLLYLPGALDILNPEYMLFGNPVLAFAVVLKLADLSYTVSAPGVSHTLEAMIVPATIVLYFLAAWIIKGAAVREVERLRQ